MSNHKFAIQTVTGLLLLRCSDILCFRFCSERHCWELIQTDRTLHHLRNSTTARELLGISSEFAQTRQNFILNLNYLQHIENKTLRCTLHPPFQDLDITISRRYYGKIKERLNII